MRGHSNEEALAPKPVLEGPWEKAFVRVRV